MGIYSRTNKTNKPIIETNVRLLDGYKEHENFSIAILSKAGRKIFIILHQRDCIIYHENGKIQNCKGFTTDSEAYDKWLKWIGKMCKKDYNSEYFLGTHVAGDPNTLHDINTLNSIFYKWLKL